MGFIEKWSVFKCYKALGTLYQSTQVGNRLQTLSIFVKKLKSVALMAFLTDENTIYTYISTGMECIFLIIPLPDIGLVALLFRREPGLIGLLPPFGIPNGFRVKAVYIV